MAISCGFYDSLNGDRKYSSPQISYLFNALIKDGVFMHVGDHLAVKQNSGMQIIVGSGLAWFNSTWTLNDTDYPLNVEAADLLAPRIDAVILEVNESTSKRDNTIKIIKGTAATIPQKPSLTNTADVHQYALAYVTVGANVTEITDANIENQIGLEGCPFVSGILETIAIDSLISQWKAQFEEWFESVQDTLSGDVAGNLLTKINQQDYRYKGTFKVSGWNSVDIEGYKYSQTISISSDTGGPTIQSDFKMTSPIMYDDTLPLSTKESVEASASIINSGKKTFSYGSMTCLVTEKPESDVEVFFTAMEGV